MPQKSLAADVGAVARGVAVAIGVAPGAETLAPDRKVVRGRSDGDRFAVDLRVDKVRILGRRVISPNRQI